MDERKRVSQAQERRLAKRSGSRLHGGSGSGSQRNDMHNEDDVYECKTVLWGKRQITLKLDDLKLVERTAVQSGRRPVLHIDLAGRRYVVLTEEDYAEMTWSQDGPEGGAG
jgi:hypothetical protein